MPLVNVLSVQLRPGAIGRYEERIQRLAAAAKKKKESFHWEAWSTAFGETLAMHYVSTLETFAQLGERGTVPQLLERVLGAKEAPEFMEQIGECTLAQQNTLSVDRPDLSYPDASVTSSSHPIAVVTDVRVRPGLRDAFEELLRKLSEAIPKVDDPTRLATNQAAIGNLAEYWTVRPARDMAELDTQRGPDELLSMAFGPGEGGLIFRNGIEAIDQIQREIVMYRPELSNPA